MTVKDVPTSNLAQWVKFLSSVLIIPIVFAAFIWARNMEGRMTRVEASRWTNEDQRAYAQALTIALALKADKIDVPPPEVKQSLDRLEKRQAEIFGMVFDLYKEKNGE